jgi:hypothetical protein
MDRRKWLLAGIALVLAQCSSNDARVSTARAAEIDRQVRDFAAQVAHGVTHDGPSAWRRYFVDSPAFFMASEGRMVFATSAAATTGIQDLGKSIQQIELEWGPELRVDPLANDLAVVASPYHEIRTDTFGHRVDESGYFTGVVEYKGGKWQFRDAHWSVAAAAGPAGH